MVAKWSDITKSQAWNVLTPDNKRTIIAEYSKTLPEKHRDTFIRGAELDVFTPEQLAVAGIEEVTPDVRIKYAGVSKDVDTNIAEYNKQQDEDLLSSRNIAGMSRAIGEGLTLGGFDELYATVTSPFTDKTWEEEYESAKEAGEKFAKAHPVIDTALQVAGGIGGAIAAPGLYVGKSGASTLAKNIGMGAIAGGLSGEGLEGRLESAGLGATIGSIIPGTAIGYTAAKKGIQKASEKALTKKYPEIMGALSAGGRNVEQAVKANVPYERVNQIKEALSNIFKSKGTEAAKSVDVDDFIKGLKSGKGWESIPGDVALTKAETAEVNRLMTELDETTDIVKALMSGKSYSQQERLGNEIVKASRKDPSLYRATKASVDANVDTPFKDQVVKELNNIATGLGADDAALVNKTADKIAKGLRAVDTEDVAENVINKENVIALIDDNIESLKGKITDEAYKTVKDRLFDLGMQRRVANRMVKLTAPQEKSLLGSLAGTGISAGLGAAAGSVLPGGGSLVGALLGAAGREALTGGSTARKIAGDISRKTLERNLAKKTAERAGEFAKSGLISETSKGSAKVIGNALEVSPEKVLALKSAAKYLDERALPKGMNKETKAAVLSIIRALNK